MPSSWSARSVSCTRKTTKLLRIKAKLYNVKLRPICTGLYDWFRLLRRNLAKAVVRTLVSGEPDVQHLSRQKAVGWNLLPEPHVAGHALNPSRAVARTESRAGF